MNKKIYNMTPRYDRMPSLFNDALCFHQRAEQFIDAAGMYASLIPNTMHTVRAAYIHDFCRATCLANIYRRKAWDALKPLGNIAQQRDFYESAKKFARG